MSTHSKAISEVASSARRKDDIGLGTYISPFEVPGARIQQAGCKVRRALIDPYTGAAPIPLTIICTHL